MRRCIIALLLAAAVIPAAALAANPDAAKSASNDCTALQAKMGATAFAQAYSSFGTSLKGLMTWSVNWDGSKGWTFGDNVKSLQHR